MEIYSFAAMSFAFELHFKFVMIFALQGRVLKEPYSTAQREIDF
jgi:hypothetical protein